MVLELLARPRNGIVVWIMGGSDLVKTIHDVRYAFVKVLEEKFAGRNFTCSVSGLIF